MQPEVGQREKCLEQTTDLGRYGSPGGGFIGSITNWGGPCISSLYENQGNDFVRPTKVTVTFDDLSTGGVTTVRWTGGNLASIVKN